MYTLDGKIAWITGSSSGIGRAIAHGFAEHGADVVVHYHTNREEAEALKRQVEQMGRRCLAVGGDISRKSDIERMVRDIEATFGGIDILVNNAGSLIRRARFEEVDETLWDRIIEVNLKSVYLATAAVLPLMKRRGGGRIVNITSMSARDGGGLGGIAYATAKGGVSTFTRALAKDLAEYGILVNAVGPGIINTPLHDKFTPAALRANFGSQIPLKREGTAEDIAGAVLFLASDYAKFMTGEVIEVNGGQLMV